MKKYIILAILLFSSNLTNVHATPIEDECIENGTCEVLCNYETIVSNGKNNGQWRRNLTIYYAFDEGLYIKYQSPTGQEVREYSKGPYPSFSYTLSNAGGFNVYWGIDYTPEISNFSCPTNGYIDTNGFNGGNEICFDNDGVTCKEEYSNFATSFGFDHNFISQKKDYDFEEQIANYKNWIFGDIKEDISNGTFKNEEEIYDKIVKDFQENFLSGNTLPAFMANSKAFQDIYNSIIEEFEETKQEALDDAKQDVADGNKTQEEYDEIANNWENLDSEKLEEEAQKALDTIQRESIESTLEWEADTCSSFLGDKNDSNDPAYYLNFIFNLLKYIAIVILFVFSIIEFGKAVISNDNDALKKAVQKTIKRLVICIVIFFLPQLINFIMELLGVIEDPTCGIGVR